MTSLVDALHAHCDEVRFSVREVEYVADLLSELGMAKVADRLALAVKFLPESAETLRSSFNDDLRGQIRHGEQQMGGLMAALVSGALRVVPENERSA